VLGCMYRVLCSVHCVLCPVYCAYVQCTCVARKSTLRWAECDTVNGTAPANRVARSAKSGCCNTTSMLRRSFTGTATAPSSSSSSSSSSSNSAAAAALDVNPPQAHTHARTHTLTHTHTHTHTHAHTQANLGTAPAAKAFGLGPTAERQKANTSSPRKQQELLTRPSTNRLRFMPLLV
jgi:hypothetical protein